MLPWCGSLMGGSSCKEVDSSAWVALSSHQSRTAPSALPYETTAAPLTPICACVSDVVALTQPPAFRLYDTTPLLSLTSSANGEPRLRESARSLERSHRRVGAACALTGNPVSGAACRRVSMYSVLLVALKQSRR